MNNTEFQSINKILAWIKKQTFIKTCCKILTSDTALILEIFFKIFTDNVICIAPKYWYILAELLIYNDAHQPWENLNS